MRGVTRRMHFWVEGPRSRDLVLFSLHASMSHGQFVAWIYFAGFGCGVDL